MTTTDSSATPKDNIRKEWLDRLVNKACDVLYRAREYEPYKKEGQLLNNFLAHHGFPEPKNAEYISVIEGIQNSIQDYINTAKDKQTAAGAVCWRLLKGVEKPIQDETKPRDYKRERHTQKVLMQMLVSLNLDMKAVDKLNVLDYLAYKYSSEEYRRLYNHLGTYKFGEDGDNLDRELSRTVKLYHKLLGECQKSTAKDKLISARAFIENAAQNGDMLEFARYNDDKNHAVYKIDNEAKAQLLKLVAKQPDLFSSECKKFLKTPVKHGVADFMKMVDKRVAQDISPNQKKAVSAWRYALVNEYLSDICEADFGLVDTYSKYLNTYANFHPDNQSVNAQVLENLLLAEAQTANKRAKAQNLFPEQLKPKELPTINKELVLKTAYNYANSFVTSHPEGKEFNPALHESMADMFSRIVSNHKYHKLQVQQLCNVLSRNPDEKISEMTKQIMFAYTNKKAMARPRQHSR